MSDPQPNGAGPEIVIDLDGEPEPRPASPPPSPIPNAALAFTAALLVLAAGLVTVWKWLPGRDPVAVEAVRSFLEAVQDRDVDAALALADPPPADEAFMVPEALDTRWKIDRVAQVAYTDDTEEADARAQVYAEIEAYDGTIARTRFTVRIDGGEARIADAVSHTEYYVQSFDFLEVNGYSARVADLRYLRLLPGIYRFYDSAPDTLDMGTPAVLALGDEFAELGGGTTSNGVGMPFPVVTDVGYDRLDQRVRAFFDGCAADPGADRCPFDPPPKAADRIRIADDAVWRIVSYPVIAVSPWSWGNNGFDLATSVPGEVRVEATVTGADGATKQETLSCGLWVEGMYGLFDYDGEVGLTQSSAADDTCRSMTEVG